MGWATPLTARNRKPDRTATHARPSRRMVREAASGLAINGQRFVAQTRGSTPFVASMRLSGLSPLGQGVRPITVASTPR